MNPITEDNTVKQIIYKQKLNQLYKLYCKEYDGNNDDEILPESYLKFRLTIKQKNISGHAVCNKLDWR